MALLLSLSYDPGMGLVTETDIFNRVVDRSNPTLTAEAARGLLQLGYSSADHARIAELAKKSNNGTLSAEQKREFESFVFVGDVFSLLKSKARLSLQKRSPAA